MNSVDLTSVSSLRIFCLLLHFLTTLSLIWTRFPAVSISLSPNYSSADYQSAEASYLTVIAFSIIFLLVEFSMLPVSYGKVYFRTILSLGLDIAAIFFNGWIVFDGLSWQSYVPIFIFCVALPTFWETLFVMPHVYRYVVDILVKCGTVVYGVAVVVGRFFEELMFDDSVD